MAYRHKWAAIPVAMLAALLGSVPVSAESVTVTPPEKVGMSKERLDRITTVFKAEIDKGEFPGAVIGVVRKGQLVYFESLGYRDPVAKDAMPANAIFAIASMTKPMVSIAIMMLRDEGKLLLSDPVGKFIPALADMKVGVVKGDTLETVAAIRQPTVQDLLRHTSGFTYGGRGDTPVHKLWPASSGTSGMTLTPQDFAATLAKAPLLYQPGTVWDYSLSVDALGLIVEAVSGKPLATFLQERLWTPLGMVDTGFSVPEAKKARHAQAFANDPRNGKPQFVLQADGKPLKFDCGGGCAMSTAPDYLRFAQMLANGGTLDGKRIIADRTLKMMTTDQLGADVRARTTSPVLPKGYSFGLGFAVRTQPGIAAFAGSEGDYYWGGAYGTYFWHDPRERMYVVFMMQSPVARLRYRYLLRDLVYQALIGN